MEYIIPEEIIVLSGGRLHSSDTRSLDDLGSTSADHPIPCRIIFRKNRDGFVHMRYAVKDTGNDYIFLEVNRNYEKLTGYKGRDVVGKSVTEISASNPGYADELIKKFYKTAIRGQPQYFHLYSPILDKDFSVLSYSPRKGYFNLFFHQKDDQEKNREDHGMVFDALNRVILDDSIIMEQEHPMGRNYLRKLKIMSENTAGLLGISGGIKPGRSFNIMRFREETRLSGENVQMVEKARETAVRSLRSYAPSGRELFFMIHA